MVSEKYGPAQTKAFIKDQEAKLAKALADAQKPQPKGYPGGGDRATCSVCRTLGHDCPRHRTVPDLPMAFPKKAKAKKALDPDDPKNDPRYAERLAKAKAVMQVFDHIREWHSDPNESSTGATYRQLLQSDGKLSCECPGWLNYSGGTEKRIHRTCKHLKEIINELRLAGKKFEVRSSDNDAWLFVIGVGQ